MNKAVTPHYQYQYGGSLPPNAPSYVTRKADTDLYQAVKAGEFCFVLNSRQMGKSSLRVRTMQRLQVEEIACVAIDLTVIGTSGLSSEQWYNGIINSIYESLKLENKLDVDALWEENKRLSPVQVFGKFIDEVLKLISTQIVIFIDEIDSILSLDFPVDDFFALIRAFFNTRVDKPEYNRINFVLLGVATPSELIKDKKRTPFNIGKGIELTGFEFTEAQPLIRGFSHLTNHPDIVLQEILNWTGGQPFLTQKICNFICESKNIISDGEEASFVEHLVTERVIKNWESQDEPEHFRTIQDRILKRDEQKTVYLLDLYQRIWHSGEIEADNSSEQSDLQLAGIVVKKDSKIKIYNLIYHEIFNHLWIERNLASLRPYAENFRQWLSRGKQDNSWLLRGKALREAEKWATDRNLGFEDREFLAASRTQEQEEKAIKIEADAKQEAERQLAIAKRRIGFGIIALSASLCFTVVSGIAALNMNQNVDQVEKNIFKVEKNISKARELSKLASQLQQEGKTNIANQFLNIAGLVLQDKVENPALKEVLLDSSLVLGYEYLVNSENLGDNQKSKFSSKYNQAKDRFNQSWKNLLPNKKNNQKNSRYLATLVYIYYVKGKLQDKDNALVDYKAALEKYNLLKSQLKSNVDLFTLDLNILYNGNADIVESLYRQLKQLDKSNPAYHELLKQHLLDELDYLMQQGRWKEADLKNWSFLLISANREEKDLLYLDDLKNFNCKDLKAIDKLWVKNSQGKFGYSVQTRIYLATGNSLYFNWEKREFINWNAEKYSDFAKKVGWKEGDIWKKHNELKWKKMRTLSGYNRRGTLPFILILDIANIPQNKKQSIVYEYDFPSWWRGYNSLLANSCQL
ncbi:MAG: hypothetical protein F6K61_02960 [Sphaerospermopsis sp. SIO1G1]|nr:hypothetical protein [Sphaerospermopsis sp. SIO1G1]